MSHTNYRGLIMFFFSHRNIIKTAARDYKVVCLSQWHHALSYKLLSFISIVSPPFCLFKWLYTSTSHDRITCISCYIIKDRPCDGCMVVSLCPSRGFQEERWSPGRHQISPAISHVPNFARWERGQRRDFTTTHFISISWEFSVTLSYIRS